jgi:TRAP-type C4-dicarboxylate transport system permease large subunit
MTGIYFLVRIKPDLAPQAVRFSWEERIKSIPGLWGVAVLFGIIIGGIYSGIFTPEEAGAVGAVAALVLLAIKARGRFYKELKSAAWDSAMTVAMMFFIVIAATVFTKFLTIAGVLDVLISVVSDSQILTPTMMIGIFIVICTIFGMFLSATASLLLLAPVAHSVLTPLGFNGIWLGIVMVKMFELAIITPPIGLNVYIAKTLVPDLELTDVFRAIGIFALMDLITVAILIAFPQLSLWLPSLM